MRVITDNAIPAMLEGMRKAVDIIKLTMGPKGRNIVIEE